MLKWMDGRKLFNGCDGVDPLLIVDRHSSRMMGPFLKFVNDPEHLWNAMLDIPIWDPSMTSWRFCTDEWCFQNCNDDMEMMLRQ
jgi:hypothetical protein